MIAYFDNAATTFPKPNSVYDFMNHYYRDFGVNIGRGNSKLSVNANNISDKTRMLLLELFHCERKKVIFTHTATEALNVVISNSITKKDKIVIYITPFEHNAVTRTLHHLSKLKDNIIIRKLHVSKESFEYDLCKIAEQFDRENPDLVIMTHVSNVIGLIAPVLEISNLSKKYGATNIVDMCQSAGLIDIDLNTENVDFAVFDGHKTLYGPFGIAGFVYNGEQQLEPIIYGGTGVDSINQDMPDVMPDRLEAGSHNILAISGLYAALLWIKEVSIAEIKAVEDLHHKRLIEIISKFDNIKIVGPKDRSNCIGVVSCVFDGYSSDNIGQVMSDNEVAVRTGLHCAPFAHDFLGTSPAGTVRMSIGYFTEADAFLKLEKVLEYIEENS